jgi:ABC-type branched-subunit amino acid transport system ATPase component
MPQAKIQCSASKPKRTGYQMIKSLRAENFRCFKDIDLADLRRVNVVVGKNAAGKTALLETIRLAMGGTPQVLYGMNPARGYFSSISQPPTREMFEAAWNAYFFNFDISKSITTECGDSQGNHANVKVFFDEKTTTMVPVHSSGLQGAQGSPQQISVVPATYIPPLAFERVNFSGINSTLFASINPQNGQFSFDTGQELGMVSEFMTTSVWGGNPLLPTQLFSQLSVQRREMAIINAVRDEFEPSLEGLTVLSPNPAQQPAIYASLQYLKEKLPISYLSSGITRFISILAVVLMRGRGVVLIDEIENGISYKIFPGLWRYLLKFAAENDTQIFASTHSQECVRALVPAMQGHEEEFSLLRSERLTDSSTVAILHGKFLEAAIEQGVEVR